MAINDFGKSTITVKKSDLLAKLKENKDKHVAEFTEIFGKYRKALQIELAAKLQDAQDGKEVNHELSVVKPDSHEQEYLRTIQMLEWSTADEIVITEMQFRQFVLDEWNWRLQFQTVGASYAGY